MSRVKIHDEFTNLKISRQRKWQLRREQRDGRCLLAGCAAPVAAYGKCLTHAVETRDYPAGARGEHSGISWVQDAADGARQAMSTHATAKYRGYTVPLIGVPVEAGRDKCDRCGIEPQRRRGAETRREALQKAATKI